MRDLLAFVRVEVEGSVSAARDFYENGKKWHCFIYLY